MKHIFSIRLDQDTYQALRILSIKTYRSRGGVVRYLLNFAIQNPHLIFPEVGNSSRDSNFPSIISINDDEQEG